MLTTALLRRPAALLLTACATGALVVTGCGDSESGSDGGTDPASVIPAAAPVYLEAIVRPEGEQAAGARAAITKVFKVKDPGGAIVALLDDDGSADYARDIEPWLGERIGLAFTGFRQGEPQVLISVASKDNDKAQDAVAKEKLSTERQHNGVDYRVRESDSFAAAVVGDAVLFGDETSLKAGIDASKGDSLAEGDALKVARDAVDEEALGFGYVNPGRAIDLLLQAGELPEVARTAVRDALGASGLKAGAAGLDLDAEAIRLDLAAVGVKGRAVEGAGDSSASLTGLPGSAVAGVGLGDVGAQLESVLGQLGAAGGIAGVSPEQLLSGLSAQFGVDVRRDLLAWMGDGAIFARGTSLEDLGGGLIVKSKDPAASRRAIDLVERLVEQFVPGGVRREGDGLEIELPGFPLALKVVASGDRFVVALGDDALREALRPRGRLGDAPQFKSAAGKLTSGVAPQVYVDVAQVVTLVSSFVGSDPGFAQAKTYLDAFGALVAGGKRDRDTVRAQVAVELK